MRRLLLLVGVLSATISTASAADLRNGTLADWYSASLSERLSAAEEMLARTRVVRVSAMDLRACIDRMAGDQRSHSQRLSEIAAACIIMLGG